MVEFERLDRNNLKKLTVVEGSKPRTGLWKILRTGKFSGKPLPLRLRQIRRSLSSN